MAKLIALVIFINLSFVCMGQDKFIELKDAVNILEKNNESSKNLHYSLSDCDSLVQHAYSLYFHHEEILLTKKYENIESLITNIDKNLINYFEYTFGIAPNIKDAFGNECKIYFPVLKYNNRAFMKIYSTDSSYSFIIELKESQKATITLMYFIHDNLVRGEIITIEEMVFN